MTVLGLKFAKMHALGNDFMVVDGVNQVFTPSPEWVRSVGDRHRGVGFDQLLVIRPSDRSDVDFQLDIHNCDGGVAEQCGNGTLCVARFVVEQNLTSKTNLAFATLGGFVKAAVCDTGSTIVVRTQLGTPSIEPSVVPFIADAPSLHYDIELAGAIGRSVAVTPVAMGNPHAVLFADAIDGDPVAEIAKELQTHERFPASTNVELVELVDRSALRLRIFERGAGETLACGTGACAAVVAARLSGYVDEDVRVEQAGGIANVRWRDTSRTIELSAPTTHVFMGEIELE